MKQMNNLKYNIKMFKGYDKNNKPMVSNWECHGAYSALGNGGQRIVVVPKLNLIIVTKNYQNGALLLPKILGMFS